MRNKDTHRRWAAGVIVILCVAMPVFAADPAPGGNEEDSRAARVPDPRSLHLRTGTVDLSLKASLLRPGAQFAAATHYVIQLDGPITPDRRARLEGCGVRLQTYLPMYAYVADLTRTDADALLALGFVRWVGPFENEWKLSPDIGKTRFVTHERKALQTAGKKRLIVSVFPEADVPTSLPLLRRAGAQIKATHRVRDNRRMIVDIADSRIKAIRSIPEVMFINEAPEAQPRNATTTWVNQSNVLDSTPLWDAGLDGQDQIAGIIDWGFNTTHCAFDDPLHDIGPDHRKILAFYGEVPNPNYNYHGSHVAGVLAGYDPLESNPNHTSMAPQAKFVFQHYDGVLDAGVFYANERLTIAHDDGARVHNNSWGNNDFFYNDWSHDIDLFTRNNEEDLVLVAVINSGQVKAPENAKNCLAVASTSDTPNQNSHCYGGYGPTADGRQRPEVFADGCTSYSADYNSSCGTHLGGGTSYATPVVSALAVLSRQYFMEGYYPDGTPTPGDELTPSGALLKALVINSAVDMTGMAGYFTVNEGWGRVVMDGVLFFAGDSRKLLFQDVRNVDGLSTDETDTHFVTVNGSGEPLKVTLVWTDVPAAVAAGFTPVNDLDLVVTAPTAGTFLGNEFSGNESVTGGSADALNNAEQVHRNTPETGVWQIDVAGTAVNDSTQGYALVVTGDVVWFEITCLKGDVNDDELIDGDDIQPFVSVLMSGGTPLQECAVDMNGVDGPGIDDVPGFVDVLLGTSKGRSLRDEDRPSGPGGRIAPRPISVIANQESAP
ncbi:MAG: S8 family serine peptidase [Planctomycetota bacterium]